MTQGVTTGYEDYQSTSKSYDNTRVAIGVDILLGTFVQHPRLDLSKQRLLDAGCGTGSFLYELVEKFGSVTGLDANSGMLKQAQAKLADFTNVSLMEGTLPELPFPDASFDAMMISQVLHHLDEKPDFKNLGKFIAEAFRILAPGGAMVIHTSSPKQVRNSVWFSWVIPEAMERMASRFAPIPVIREMLENTGFESIRATAPLESLYNAEAYLDQEGPFRAEWRACDSMFALATDDELEQGLQKLKISIENDSVQTIIDAAEVWRHQSGQSTFISVRKP